MKAAAGERQARARDGGDLFALAALVDLEKRLSPRSRAALALLRSRGPAGATTLELANASGSLAVHTLVDQLRKKLPAGWRIRSERRGTTEGERVIYAYTLEEAAG